MSIKEGIVKEYVVSLGDPGRVFKVIRGFFMKVRNGPTILVEPGTLVELSKESYEMLFSIGKVSPLEIPSKFKVVVPFRCVINSLYSYLRAGDIVELEQEEALKYWRQGFVKPIEEEV